MGSRKPPKKPEKKGLFASLFGGFGGGNKDKDKDAREDKRRPASKGGKTGSLSKTGALSKTGNLPQRKGQSLAKKPKPAPQAAPPVDDYLNDDPLAGIEDDLLGALDGDPFGGFDMPPPPVQAPPAPPPMAQPRPQSAPAAAALPPQGSGLFGPEGVDNALDSLFDSFEIGGAPPAAAPRPQAPAPQAAPPPAAARPQAPAPQAPVAAAPPAARPQPPQQAPAAAQPDGLVSIGKLLIDQNTLKRIIDNAEKRGSGLYTTTRIISGAKGADLDSLLASIDSCEGVSGSLIVGRDGLVISSTLPQGFDKELVGAISSSMLTNLEVQCKKMKLGGMRQVLMDTEGGVVLLIAQEVGVLVIMSQSLVGFDLTAVLAVVAGMGDKL